MKARAIKSVPAILALSIVTNCGKAPSNTAFPPESTSVPLNNAEAGFVRWKLLLKEMKLNDGADVKSESDLKSILSQPSGLLSASAQSEYSGLLAKVAADFNKTYYSSRCASVTSLTKIGAAKKLNSTTGLLEDLSTADVYLMKYNTLKDATTPETLALPRSGLVVLPSQTSGIEGKAPLVSFAHGGDFGLTYDSIAGLFGSLQSNHIILAPAFPGESICKNGTSFASRGCDEAGKWSESSPSKKSPYEGDALELLAMQNCFVRAGLPSAHPASMALPVFDSSGKDTGVNLSSTVQLISKRLGGTSTAIQSLPVSYMAGVSRGGLTATSALARSGSYLQAKLHETAEGTAGKIPSLYSCNIDIFGPKTFLATDFRIGFEGFVRGYGNNTRFIQLPTANELFEKWSAYGKGTSFAPGTVLSDAENAKLAAIEVLKIDMPLLTPMVLGALRNWSRFGSAATVDNRGAMLSIHGVYDQVVPFTQSLFGSTVFNGINANFVTTKTNGVPGVSYDALAVTPPNKYLDGVGTKGAVTLKRSVDGRFVSQHGDTAFSESSVSGSLTSCEAADASVKPLCEAANKAKIAKYTENEKGNTPDQVVGKWLADSCASASAP